MTKKMQPWYETLEMLKGANALPERVLLYGPPGTGKSSLPARLYENVERVALTEDTSADELIGTWALRDGQTVVIDGPATRAMRKGVPLVIDEIDRTGPGVEAVLHAILDDPEIAQVVLPDGTVVKPEAGFRVFATTNASPTTLGEALYDRFDLILSAHTPHPQALAHLKDDERTLVANYYAKMKVEEITTVPSVRRVRAFHQLRKKVGLDRAASLVFGPLAKDIAVALDSAVQRA